MVKTRKAENNWDKNWNNQYSDRKTIYYLYNLFERQSSTICILCSSDDHFQRLQKEIVQNNNLSNMVTTRKAEDDWDKDWKIKPVNHKTIYYLHNLSETQSSAICVLCSSHDNREGLQKEMVQNNN